MDFFPTAPTAADNDQLFENVTLNFTGVDPTIIRVGIVNTGGRGL